MIVPQLPHITVLSIGLSQMFVPAIIRIFFDFKEESKEKKTEENGKKKENAGEVPQEKTSKTCLTILKIITRFFVFIMFLVHFAVIGYNAYIRGLDEHWIALLYLHIIWSSLKYAGNYLKVDNKISPPKKNFETDYMRSWIASIFQIISKINLYSFNNGSHLKNYALRTPLAVIFLLSVCQNKHR